MEIFLALYMSTLFASFYVFQEGDLKALPNLVYFITVEY